jgi:hypothetical protein
VLVLAWACCWWVLPQLVLGEGEPVSDASKSICQDMLPSPTLEMFVDKLPRMKKISVSNGKQLTLGAYKIKQVRHPLAKLGSILSRILPQFRKSSND